MHESPTDTLESPPSRLLGAAAGELVLRVRGSHRDGQIVRLSSPKCSVGAAPSCTLRLVAAQIRPLHCVILRGRRGAIVRRWSADTRLNGRTFDDAPLAAGDRLSIGPIEFDVLESSDSVDSPPAASQSGQEHLRRQCDQQRRRTRRLIEELRTARDRASRFQTQADRSSQHSDSLEERLDQLEVRLAEYRKSEEAVQTQRDSQAEEAKTWRETAEKLETQFHQQHQSLEDRCHQLQSERNQLKTQLEENSLHVELQQQELQTARSAAREQQHQESDELTERIAKLEDEKQLFELEKKSLEQQRQQWRQERQDLETQLQQRQQLETDFDNRRRQFEQEQKTFQEQRASLEQQRQLRLQEQRAEKGERQRLDDELKQQRRELDEQHAGRRQELEQLERESSERAEHDAQARELILQEKEIFQAERSDWQRQRQEQDAQLQERCEQLERQQEQLKTERAEIESLRDEVRQTPPHIVASDEPASGDPPALGHLSSDGDEQSTPVSSSQEEELAFESISESAPPSTADVLKKTGRSDVWAEEEETASKQTTGRADPLDPLHPGAVEDSPPHGSQPREEPAGGADDPGDEQEKEESIEQYMQRLLQRVRGGDTAATPTETTVAATTPIGTTQEVASPTDKSSADTMRSIADKSDRSPAAEAAAELPPLLESPTDTEGKEPSKLSREEYQPRTKPPEETENLEAMRQLANQSARGAIDTSVKRRWARAVSGKLAVSTSAAILGGVLLSTSDQYMSLLFAGSVVSFCVALIWAVQAALVTRSYLVADRASRPAEPAAISDQSGSHPTADDDPTDVL